MLLAGWEHLEGLAWIEPDQGGEGSQDPLPRRSALLLVLGWFPEMGGEAVPPFSPPAPSLCG